MSDTRTLIDEADTLLQTIASNHAAVFDMPDLIRRLRDELARTRRAAAPAESGWSLFDRHATELIAERYGVDPTAPVAVDTRSMLIEDVVQLRGDMRHNAAEVAILDRVLVALRAPATADTCTFCGEKSDGLSVGSDGASTACADCMAEGEA